MSRPFQKALIVCSALFAVACGSGSYSVPVDVGRQYRHDHDRRRRGIASVGHDSRAAIV
jgi:hypothetical protein